MASTSSPFLPLLLLFLLAFANAQYHSYSQYKYNTAPVNSHSRSSNGFNPNLDVSLVDIEPEANLLLDESTIEANGSQDDLRHFALVHPANSVVVRATYGPFSARQTINPFSVNSSSSTAVVGKQPKSGQQPQSAGIAAKQQITAYLVTKEVRRSHPVLRVLFYASHLFEFRSSSASHSNEEEEDKTLCAAIIVQYHGERLFGTCSPSKSKRNACLAEVTIPALYWPPLDVSNGGIYAAKQQKSSTAKVYYTIAHTAQSQQCNDQNFLSLLATGDGEENVSDLSNAESSMNLIFLSDVSLVPFRGSYEEVTNDNVVTVLIPQEPVYPNSKIYIPVKYTYNPDYPVSAFSLRVQVKPGLKILGAQLSHPNKLWQLSVELGAKQTTATVTAFLRDYDQQDSQQLPDELMENMSQEVYSWLIEVEENIDVSEVNGRIVWQLLYNTDSASVGRQFDIQQHQSYQQQEDEDFEKESAKLTSLIDIQKDVVQEILAITKSKELLNTAILNGRQVSRTMRIYQVSAAGSISDITFQCSCQSADESVLKVSPSCTSVYMDGSEVRGSQNATILIKYGSFTGQGNFIVWMPLIPLDVRVTDSKLSQIKGWRVPHHSKHNVPFESYENDPRTADGEFDLLDEEMLLDVPQGGKYWPGNNVPLMNNCRLRFQQSRIEVYTRFLSSDHNSGREASLLNRRYSLCITHLVRNLIRVSDNKILRLRGNLIEGMSVGRADVEIISALTGSVIGSREVRVTMDRESISKMEVQPVSGIRIEVEPFESSSHNIWSVRTQFNSRLSKQYQEALLDVKLHFTDQTVVSLSEVSPTDYKLTISTFKGVVDNVTREQTYSQAASSTTTGLFSHQMPRIIALLPGQGELVHITLDVHHQCHRKKAQPLAVGHADIDVDFQLPDITSSSVQNDAINYRRFGSGRQFNQTETFFNRVMNPKKRKDEGLVPFLRRNHPPIPGANGGDRISYQRHSTLSPTSDTGIKFGIYSLIVITSIACVIVIILYSMFSLRFRHKSPYVTTTAGAAAAAVGEPNSDESNGGERPRALHTFGPFSTCVNKAHRTSISNAKEWTWVGGNELENGATTGCKSAIQGEEDFLHSRPLLPDHTDQSTDFRITTNPAEMLQFNDEHEDDDDCDDELLSCLETNHRHNGGVLIPPSHKSTRIVPNLCPDTPPPPVPSRTRHIPIPKRSTNGFRDCSGKPPVPPHRLIKSDQSSPDQPSPPPPIPPHRTKPTRPHHLSLNNETELNRQAMMKLFERLRESDA